MEASCWRVFLFICSVLTISVFAAPPFEIPPGWKSPSFNISREERINIAQRAMDLIAQNLSVSDGYGVKNLHCRDSAHVLTGVAMAEYTAGTMHFRDTLPNVFELVAAGLGHGDPNSGLRTKTFQVGAFDISQEWTESLIEWGIAFVYASRAYNSTDLQTLAETLWNEAVSFHVTTDNAAQGTHPKRNVTFNSSCNNRSIAGGVWSNNSTTGAAIPDVLIGAAATARFLSLSAHLAELTNNQTYADAAILAATFIKDHLLTSDSLVPTSIDLSNCILDSTLWSSYTGAAVEGLSVLANVTNDGRWYNLAVEMTIAATQSSKLTNANGIVHEQTLVGHPDADHKAMKGDYVEALYHVWERNVGNATFAKYLESYIAVQFNALRSTSANNSGYYSSIWDGTQSVSTWSLDGVLVSMGVLAAAIGPSSTPLASQGSQTSTSSPAPTLGPQRAVIVGAVVGTLVLICLLLLLGLFLMRRRCRSLESRDITSILKEKAEAANIIPVVRPHMNPSQQPFVPLKGHLAAMGAVNDSETPASGAAGILTAAQAPELVYYGRPPYDHALPSYERSTRM